MIRSLRDLYRSAFAGLPGPVWALAAVTLVNRAGTMVLPFLMLYLTTQRGYSATEAGLALSLYGVGAVGGSVLGGRAADRIGSIRTQGLSLVLTAATFFVLGGLRSRAAIGAAILTLAVVGEAFRPASATAFAAASDAGNRVRAFALSRLAINLGMTVGPAAGGFLALLDYRWLFWADGGTCLLAAAVLWLLFRRRPHPASAVREPVATTGRSPWSDRPFLAVCLLNTLLLTVFFQLVGTFPLTLRALFRLTEERIGLLLAVNTVLIVLFEMVLAHLLARFDPLRVVAIGSLFVCIGFGALPLGSGAAYAVFTVMIWTVGEMLTIPFAEGYVANRGETGRRGMYLGLHNVSFAVAFVVAPIAGTWAFERVGPIRFWAGCGALGPLLCAGFLVVAAGARREAGVSGSASGSRA